MSLYKNYFYSKRLSTYVALTGKRFLSTKTTNAFRSETSTSVSPSKPPMEEFVSSKEAPKSNLLESKQHFYMNKTLDQYCKKRPTPLTLRQLMFYERHINEERLLKSANYVRTELPIRIAHRIREFQKLPYILGTNPNMESVYDLYWQAFERLRKVPEIHTMAQNEEFCDILQESLDAHSVIIPKLTKGINECDEIQRSIISAEKLDDFMNATLRSRISRRVITEHHLVLSNRKESIFSECSSYDVLTKCICLVKANITNTDTAVNNNRLPEPNIRMIGSDTKFTYVSDHIEYIIYQLLSNAYRHTLETATDYIPKDIIVTLCSNETNVLFRVSDQGGGMSKELHSSLWSFCHYVNNLNRVDRLEAKVHEQEKLALRLGIGLPMSKVYAEYWGGDINIMTMEGYGTDAYVRIPKLGIQNENIATNSPLNEAIM
ncbi:branched-chain alpha-ketoacid dehydrogenase [Mycotypha africana]|uniref:branched-chain alpha-ketoacid dehydrogenase n=1 Tax=Mycotypha africana TaxID=64632 RepID=UPI0023004787|nr:branched-chain alpha-ketoacid dehydrogenase [Mycotypha africana]KAI8973765.1 branched-chain alpha-ketoacid dehydrogenase [Mycotypha africana]